MNDADFRALVEQSHLLDELTKTPGWAVYVDYLQTVVVNPISKSILNGRIESYEDYKEKTGYNRGVARALGVIDEVGKQVLHERERRQEAEVAALSE